MIPEIDDVKRIAHPRRLVSWMGMDIQEYSSDGKPNRFGINKQGNRCLRTAFIEANQRGYRTTHHSHEIKARRAQFAPEIVAIGDRCLQRLTKKREPVSVAWQASEHSQGGLCLENGGLCVGVALLAAA